MPCGSRALKVQISIALLATNCKHARTLIAERFEPGHLITYRCMAHVFNLIGSQMSVDSVISSHLKQLGEFANTINRNFKLSALLKDAGAKKIVKTVVTRWYSTCGCINSALGLKQYLETQIPKTKKYSYDKLSPTLESYAFWSDLEALKVYFDRLASMIGLAELATSTLSNSFRCLLEYCQFLFNHRESRPQILEISPVCLPNPFQQA